MPHSSSPTPPSSSQPLHGFLALTQQLTPSKSPRTGRRVLIEFYSTESERQGQLRVKPPHFISIAHFPSFFLDLRFLHPGTSRRNGVVRRQLQAPTGQVPRTDTQHQPYNGGCDCNCVNPGVFLFYPTMLFLSIFRPYSCILRTHNS
jgi:hypothetical protein